MDAAKSYRQSLQLALSSLDDEEDDEDSEDEDAAKMQELLGGGDNKIQYEDFADAFAQISLEIAQEINRQEETKRKTIMVSGQRTNPQTWQMICLCWTSFWFYLSSETVVCHCSFTQYVELSLDPICSFAPHHPCCARALSISPSVRADVVLHLNVGPFLRCTTDV